GCDYMKYRRRTIIILAVMVGLMNLMAFSAMAADMDKLNQELDNQNESNRQSFNLWLELFKLIVVLGLIIAAAYAVIRLFSRQVTGRIQGNWLHVIDEVMLGQNRGIILCEVGERVFAVGVTDHNISVLFEVNDPELLEQVNQYDDNQPDQNDVLKGIKDTLSAWFKTRTLVPANRNKQTEFHSLMEEQVKRLQNMSATNSGGPQEHARMEEDKRS
ncbi:MAG: flagellar biosynthetic protein FliO, partial [Syntrophomonadaceae bacterium]|nr:flagellar biosynthetic protein FliO [Syntrophomonadaceae bacterium]